MQLSKLLLVLGATSVSLIPLAGRASDKAPVAPLIAPPPAAPDAVEKAREAMRLKLEELQGGAPAAPAPAKAAPAPVAPAPAPAATPNVAEKPRATKHKKFENVQAAPDAPAAVAKPAPAPAPSAIASAPAPSPAVIPVADPAAIDKAREAMRQKMSEMNSQAAPAQAQPAQTAEVPKNSKKQKQQQAQAAAKPAKAKSGFAEQPATSQVAMTKSQPEPVKAAKPSKKTKAPELAVKPVQANHAMSFEPLSGPPSPLSSKQQQELSDLLVKYKADQITPEQYHTARAKVLAEP